MYAIVRHWALAPVFSGLAFLLASIDTRVSLLMYVLRCSTTRCPVRPSCAG
jgi:hypothetical protein